MGAGMMGAEIALCFAASGRDVKIKDVTAELAQRGKARLEKVLDKAVQKGNFDAGAKSQALDRITPTGDYGVFQDADLVVEAVAEDVTIKKQVFQELDRICKPECIFATNTSSIPVSGLATSVGPSRIGRFLGMHFFSPAFVMKLVEVIPGLQTEERFVPMAMECCRSIGKSPIRVKDVAGFALNRLLHAMWIEANRLLEENVASVEDIDTACKLGLGHPVGPFALMDLTSNDLNLSVQEVLYNSYGERFRPRPILKQMVNARLLGRKTGQGWYRYEK